MSIKSDIDEDKPLVDKKGEVNLVKPKGSNRMQTRYKVDRLKAPLEM